MSIDTTDDEPALLLNAAVVADLLGGLLDQSLDSSPLSAREFELTTVLMVRGALSPSELATATGVPAPSVSRITGRLERAGMVRQREHPSDGRSRILDLTADGRAAFAEAQSAFRELFRSVADVLGDGLPVVAFGMRRLEWALRVISGTPTPDQPPGIETGLHAVHFRGPRLNADEETEVLDYIEWILSRRRARELVASTEG